MNEVVCVFLMEAGALCVVVELFVDLLEVPRIFQVDDIEDHVCLRGDAADVGLDLFGEFSVFGTEDQMQFVNREIVLLDKPDVGAPYFPTAGSFSADSVLPRAEDGDDSCFHGVVLSEIGPFVYLKS